MFEKEAKEKAKRKIYNLIVSDLGVSQIITGQTCETVEGMPHFYQYSLEKMWQEGAEFGYNKANEWHDLRKDPNDLPKDNDEKLCFYEKGKVVARYDSEYNCWETYFNNFETVIPLSVIIAWKEIVLPKENE